MHCGREEVGVRRGRSGAQSALIGGDHHGLSKMPRRVPTIMALSAVIVVSRWPAAAGQALAARVMPTVSKAPSDVVIQAFVEPDTRNRSLSFVIDSGAFYTSSVAELEGDRAARVKEVRFRMMPAGSYQVRVTLLGVDGERGHFVCDIELR
jgi:hypothetical protein